MELAVEAAGSDPQATLARLIEREFNRPFPTAQPAQPFRFMAVDEGGSFQLMLVYDHYVASGDSIARLLTGIACGYMRPDRAPDAVPMERYSATYRSLFLRHPWWAVRAILGLPRMVANARRAYRPRYAQIADAHNAYTYLRLGPHQTRALLRTAKAWGVTLNELLMASLMLALSPLAAGRRHEVRRNELAVASILSMRQDFGPDAHQALSPFLAAFRVSHTVPEGIGLQQLAQEVHISLGAHQAPPPVPAEHHGARRIGAVVAVAFAVAAAASVPEALSGVGRHHLAQPGPHLGARAMRRHGATRVPTRRADRTAVPAGAGGHHGT